MVVLVFVIDVFDCLVLLFGLLWCVFIYHLVVGVDYYIVCVFG